MSSMKHQQIILQYIEENGPCSVTDVKEGTELSFTSVRIEVAVLEALNKIYVEWVGHTKVLTVNQI